MARSCRNDRGIFFLALFYSIDFKPNITLHVTFLKVILAYLSPLKRDSDPSTLNLADIRYWIYPYNLQREGITTLRI